MEPFDSCVVLRHELIVSYLYNLVIYIFRQLLYNSMASKQLRDIDIKILEEIERNEGSSKQSVVRALSMIRSRIPVLNSIDYLEGEELIIARMDKPNSQRYHLYINQENMRGKLIKNLNTFTRCFIRLLDTSQKQFDHWEVKIRKLDPDFYWDIIKNL